jgi:O-succinylhomoserine sulfhydrylase
MRVCSIAANFGDVRSIITHPASTTHGRLTEAQRQAAGITQAMIRLGVGLEDVNDLKADLARGLDRLVA